MNIHNVFTPENLDWFPHIAVLAYWDGEKIVATAYLCVFRHAFKISRHSYIWAKPNW